MLATVRPIRIATMVLRISRRTSLPAKASLFRREGR